ncbi:hypothetical protein PanWU01x14_102560 [Parasponia andersonii]|uniref:Uncharacterized protein n=1 Tax=Parasponia andersonii TaxID=3476 RepID=A0A2P5D2D4_PARAD|nr:hypothetical protein PanWU01x14_102560 [Parasponia andersonii]
MDDDNNATNAINDNQTSPPIPLEHNSPSSSSLMPPSSLSSTNLKSEEEARRPLPLRDALSALRKAVAAVVETESPSLPLG